MAEMRLRQSSAVICICEQGGGVREEILIYPLMVLCLDYFLKLDSVFSEQSGFCCVIICLSPAFREDTQNDLAKPSTFHDDSLPQNLQKLFVSNPPEQGLVSLILPLAFGPLRCFYPLQPLIFLLRGHVHSHR